MGTPVSPQGPEKDGDIQAALTIHQLGSETDGLTFLAHQADNNDFFLLGELHGDNQIPALLRTLWPLLWKLGYRQIGRSQPMGSSSARVRPRGTEPSSVCAFADRNPSVLWGPEYLLG